MFSKETIISILITTAIVIVVTVLAFLTFQLVLPSIANPPNPEYERFVEINAMCPCTAENSSYCQDRSICIHAYEYCQRKQCPQCFTVPW
ncbi:MAG: hypothetical protein MUO73_03225 [Thermoplasmata archaeon]|nr:hypothetical protein [Thermoplasmata archaeon]